MSNDNLDFDPLKGYDPAEIKLDDIKAVKMSDEMMARLMDEINDSISTAGTVNEVLAVLSNVGQFAIKLGVQVLAQSAEGAIDDLMET